MNATIQPASPGRHKRRCTVCKHPDRELIEQEFLNWRTADVIAAEFGIKDFSTIYRHAHALGLFQRRRLNVRCIAEQFLECAERVKPDADSVLQAMRAFAQITPDGQWIEPQKQVIVTHVFGYAQPGSRAKQKRSVPKSRTDLAQQADPPQPRPNGAGRTQKKVARQLTKAQQLITAARHRSSNFAWRAKPSQSAEGILTMLHQPATRRRG